MSKLYKELKYNTDRVMQPGDPLTSFDGTTAIRAGNATGKGFIETYGNVIANSYEVTIDIPQVPGAKCRVRLDDTNTSGIGETILSISGWPNATGVDNKIVVNGAVWGEISAEPAWSDTTYPDHVVIPVAEVIPYTSIPSIGIFIQSYQYDFEGQCCTWSNLEQVRQTTSKEISTTDQIPSLPLSVANGGTGVDGSSQSANKVLASPVSGTGAISFRALVAADIPDLSTSKLTTGTLGVARGGTGKISHTVNSVIIGGISTTGALQNVASASGAFYSTGSNKKPTFGTLPVAQGGTGVNGSSQAINKVFASPASGNAGAVSFRSLTVADLPTGTTSSTVALGNHTHSDYVSKSTTSNQNISGAITLVNTGNITVSPTSGGVSAGIGVASGNDAYVHASQDGVGGTEINPTGLAHYHPDGTVTDLTFPVPAKSGVIVTSTSLAENLNILPITTSTALSITMTADKYMYKVTDSGATGTFPTLTAPTGLPADCYYKFEMEWVTASPTATYAQTESTTPAMKWISSPVMQTDGLSHTYHISGRYDTTTSTFWMSCWKIDDAQGTITPDAHTLKYLLTTPTQTTSTTTNANDTITVQLSDHAINSVNVPVSVTNVVLKFPGQAVGKARDFFVRLIVTGSTVPSITLTEPDGSAIDFDVDDDSWTEIEQGVNLLMFTETAQ